MFILRNLIKTRQARLRITVCLTFLAINFYFVARYRFFNRCEVFFDEGANYESGPFLTDYTGDELEVKEIVKNISWFHAHKNSNAKNDRPRTTELQSSNEANHNYNSTSENSKTWSSDLFLPVKRLPKSKKNYDLNSYQSLSLKNRPTGLASNVRSAMIKTQCPRFPPNLVGSLPIITSDTTPMDLIYRFPFIKSGGRIKPSRCIAWQRTAIIIPYRDRLSHLHVLLRNLIPLLRKQQVDATFFVIEQAMPTTFNRGALFNIGFLEAEKVASFDCYILHDVDLMPLNDKILYRCRDSPVHFSVLLNKFEFKFEYKRYFGGVVAFTRQQYHEINGHSNIYFGWGGEDDDLLERTLHKGYSIYRYPLTTARYFMIKHERDKSNDANPLRHTFLTTGTERQDIEGLNTIKYKVNSFTKHRLYTWIIVFINQTEILEIVPEHIKTRKVQSKGARICHHVMVLVFSCAVGLTHTVSWPL